MFKSDLYTHCFRTLLIVLHFVCCVASLFLIYALLDTSAWVLGVLLFILFILWFVFCVIYVVVRLFQFHAESK